MRQRIARRFRLLDGGKLVLLSVLTGIVLIGGLGVRAWHTNTVDREVCAKIDKLDNALIAIVQGAGGVPKPGDYGYSYYRAHPMEAAALRAAAPTVDQLAALRGAACDPSNLVGP